MGQLKLIDYGIKTNNYNLFVFFIASLIFFFEKIHQYNDLFLDLYFFYVIEMKNK